MRIALLLATAVFAHASCNNSGENNAAETDNANTTTVTESNGGTTAGGTASDGHTDHNHPAGTEETHKTDVMGAGPHKGIIVHGSSGHMEMAFDGKDAAFYPLDGRTEPVDANGWTGSATVQYEGGDVKNVTLKNKNGGLVAEGINTGKTFKAIVALNGTGTTMTATFNTAKSTGGDGHSHDEGDAHDHSHGEKNHQH